MVTFVKGKLPRNGLNPFHTEVENNAHTHCSLTHVGMTLKNYVCSVLGI